MDHVNNFLTLTRKPYNDDFRMLEVRRKVVCKSGLEMSIQASEFHYCHPRTNTPPYTSVEVGYPNRRIPEFAPFADDMLLNDGLVDEVLEDGVYGYVAVEIVNKVIEDNGGIIGFAIKED